jgi:hypothetical protein
MLTAIPASPIIQVEEVAQCSSVAPHLILPLQYPTLAYCSWV